ncbi:hypothetical protein [Micromonospora ureilytica]|uniref:Uncharacterized protein n=1 Tax=Micromonospora ureilytica TaxID=709868 RepID=A0ABS0JHY5_9ACTN|nr:hypothetical protein [Micromonospora ureilytica]MBG6066672.1 hypothetical protein [Micromonospora ureilytica]
MNQLSLRTGARTRLVSGALAIGMLSGLLSAVTAGPQAASAASNVDGSIARSETTTRSQFWVTGRFTYTQTGTWAPDPQGRTYRRDCSGLVSMAWHLPSSRTTSTFASWSGKFYLPGLNDLRRGDALLRSGHIELFVGWVNPSRKSDGAWVYSFNQTGETVRNPSAASNYGNLGKNSWSEMQTYRPIRYKKIAEDTPPPAPPAPNPGILREPDGSISVVVGGVPFELTGAEYAALGSPAYTSVPAGTFVQMPSIVADGTFVRTTNGAIHLIVGSAKYPLSAAEWTGLGKPAFTDVPTRMVDGFDGSPADNTFLRNPANNSIYQVVGGAKYYLSSAEYAALGSPKATNVPAGFIDSITRSVPVDDTFLRNPVNNAIYQVVGGAKYYLTGAELAALGSPSATDVPAGFINRAGAVPADGSFLRNSADGAIYQIVGGAKYYLSAVEYSQLDSVPATNVPAGLLETITSTVPSAGFMRDVTDGSLYVVVNGAKYWLTSAEYAQLGNPPTTDVPAGFVGRLGSVPSDGSILRDVSDGALYLIVGGTRHWLSGADLTALGNPTHLTVPSGFLERFPAGTPMAGATFLRDVTDGAFYQVINGARHYLTGEEWASLGRPVMMSVPSGLLNGFGAVPGGTVHLRDVANGSIFLVSNGTKRYLSGDEWYALPAEQQSYIDVTASFLDVIPNG